MHTGSLFDLSVCLENISLILLFKHIMHCEKAKCMSTARALRRSSHSSVNSIQRFVHPFIMLCALWFIRENPLYSRSEVKGVLAPSQSIKTVKSSLNQSSPCACVKTCVLVFSDHTCWGWSNFY